MNKANIAITLRNRLTDVLARMMNVDRDSSVEDELLMHFPFARMDQRPAARPMLRVTTTSPGRL